MKLAVPELARRILARGSPHAVRWIAVDGLAGAGKSTLARHLATSLGNAPIVPMDDFLAWDDISDFVPRLVAEVVAPLLRGEDLRYQQRDWVNDWGGRGLGPYRDIPFSSVVILEGVSSARRELAPYLAHALWIETPPDVCLRRGIERDGEGARALWESFAHCALRFFEADGTRERADLVIDGEAPVGEAEPCVTVLRDAPP